MSYVLDSKTGVELTDVEVVCDCDGQGCSTCEPDAPMFCFLSDYPHGARSLGTGTWANVAARAREGYLVAFWVADDYRALRSRFGISGTSWSNASAEEILAAVDGPTFCVRKG